MKGFYLEMKLRVYFLGNNIIKQLGDCRSQGGTRWHRKIYYENQEPIDDVVA